MKPLWRSVIISTALLISGIVAVGVAPNLLAQQELAKAQSRWAERDFKRYRMVVETDSGFSQVCRQDVEIENEKVINVFQDCKKPGSFVEQPTVTITDLFNELEKYTAKTECGPNGCSCDGVISADVSYDPQLGYPRQIELKLKQFNFVEQWMHPQARRGAIAKLQGGGCTLIGFVGHKIKVLFLTPSPAEAKKL
ncbi:DUF6174 domain-containing protein [Allocoleopsis sp.]|uniref:DUF6174 domain-containing protein n=1 Tax=Allocoleopsis sp. TaxID=3088169 RepID=UPI002FD36002